MLVSVVVIQQGFQNTVATLMGGTQSKIKQPLPILNFCYPSSTTLIICSNSENVCSDLFVKVHLVFM